MARRGKIIRWIAGILLTVLGVVACLGVCSFGGLVYRVHEQMEAERAAIREELDAARASGDVQAEHDALVRLRDSGPATHRESSQQLAELELARGDTEKAADHVLDMIVSDMHADPPLELLSKLEDREPTVRAAWFDALVKDDHAVRRLTTFDTKGRWTLAIEASDPTDRAAKFAVAAGTIDLLVVGVEDHGGRTSEGRQLQLHGAWWLVAGQPAQAVMLPGEDPHGSLIKTLGADSTCWYFYASNPQDDVATDRLITWIENAEHSDMSSSLQLVGVAAYEIDSDGDDDMVFRKYRVAHLPDRAIVAFAKRFKKQSFTKALMQSELYATARLGFSRVMEERGLTP